MRKSQKQTSPNQDLSRKRLGDYGEGLVARWYEAQGYEVVERQWRGPLGEIDLILRSRDTLVFCEVKTRSSTAFGVPAEAVTWAKQKKLRATAALYLQAEHNYVPVIRFDVAGVLNGKVEVIAGAF